MHSSGFSFSIGSVVQCVFLAGVAYILAGAPLSSLVSSDRGAASYSSATSSGAGAGAGPHVAAKLESLVFPEPNLTCAEHSFKGVYVLSREPLVVYIEGFLSAQETESVVASRYVTCIFSLSLHQGASMTSHFLHDKNPMSDMPDHRSQ